MTDLDKIIAYYQKFDEWGRLDTFPGKLELQVVLEIVEQYVSPPDNLFDLGGGAGRYSYELALRGYPVYLADLSPDLIGIAREKLTHFEGAKNIKGMEVANALDLSHMQDKTHDNVLLFGPLYHLTQEGEIQTCLAEVYRVLKFGGKIFAAYIPYHCGLISILERSMRSPQQVNDQVFARVFKEGTFHNLSDSGFQEGNFLKTADLLDQFEKQGFQTLLLRSIRGIGYGKEEEILKWKEERPDLYREVMRILHRTAADPPILETCGHAIYVGQKSK